MMQNYSWNGFSYTSSVGMLSIIVCVVLIAALLVLKAYAVWHAAQRGEKVWFACLFIFNTFGILELIYLIFIVGKWNLYKKEV